MNPTLNKGRYLIFRELWENKGGVLWTPTVISVAVILFMILAVAVGRWHIGGGGLAIQLMEMHGWSEDRDEPVKIIDFNSGTAVVSTDSNLDIGGWMGTPAVVIPTFQHGSIIAFEFVALIVAVVYLLGALFNDRKDRSILFWKSLPISETTNVLTKVIFAVTVIPFVALLCSVPVQLVGTMAIAWGYSLSDSITFMSVFSEFSLIRVLVTAVLLLLVLAIKSLPFYSWLLLASAVAKRSPLLLAFIVPATIIAVESIILGTSYVSDFFGSLFITHRFDSDFFKAENALQGAMALMNFSFAQIFKIVVVTTLFLGGAIWFRNNRYEI